MMIGRKADVCFFIFLSGSTCFLDSNDVDFAGQSEVSYLVVRFYVAKVAMIDKYKMDFFLSKRFIGSYTIDVP